jgi:hypothetical protein
MVAENLSSERVQSLVVTVVGDGAARRDRARALTELVKALAFEEDTVARLNLYAEALDAVEGAEEFSTLGLAVNGKTVRVREVKAVTQ